MPANNNAPVLLLFGAGRNIGLEVTRKFIAEGWKVATVSRNPSDELKSIASLTILADLADPTSINGIFDRVEKELGALQVVVYNAYSMHINKTENPLSIPLPDFQKDINVNTVSAYAAASRAVISFSNNSFPMSSASPAFIYTGNMMNTLIFPVGTSLGIGKNASAYFLETAAKCFDGRIRFYYADERNQKGESVMNGISGETHAKFYWDLANRQEQGAWAPTFVKVGDKIEERQIAGTIDRPLWPPRK
ncbi:putative short-chain dehydrogenase [Bisporella sp. PMI_857]|nr:putative short-chain dehydrogenase [Bisporella sp. PMI_857]